MEEMREPRVRRLLALLVATAALLFLLRLGVIDLWAPDEPRFAQVAEELRSMEHGATGLVLLHLNGQPYTQKPPLYYWAAALLGAPGGRVSESAARLPSALAGVACVLVTVALGRALFGSLAAGLWSGALLLTVYRFAFLARRAQLDVILALFECLALLAYWRLLEERGRRTGNLVLLHGALGLAVLTKGPVGLLPIPIMAAHLAWEGRAGVLRTLFPPWSFLLSLAPALLWISLAVAFAAPGFFGDAVVDNLLGRFFSGTSHVRPVYYYAYQLPLDFMPWTLLWPLAAWTWHQELRKELHNPHPREGGAPSSPAPYCAARFLLVWIALPLAFFTLSAGKRGLYLVPVYPALALLCGVALERSLARRSELPALVSGGLAGLAALLAATGIFLAANGGLSIAAAPGFTLSAGFGVLVAGIALAAAMAWWAAARHRRPAAARVGVVVGGLVLLYLALFIGVFPGFEGEKSPRPISVAAAELTPPGEPIAVFDHREMAGAIAYYGRRPVATLRSQASVRAFLAGGGRAIIVKARKLERLESIAGGPLVVRARARSGRRELLVVGPQMAPEGKERAQLRGFQHGSIGG
ncbi:MAG: glycosyltransferase family 39 protein [Deltaproteobacteria bacterium]|nr:glycosyltransferase family 39 protein [Deltaproteobacteria bacterium]MBW2417059.1 glycosyltransferase family 39 protein [Deltaproteobacteria bacterium]